MDAYRLTGLIVNDQYKLALHLLKGRLNVLRQDGENLFLDDILLCLTHLLFQVVR